MRALRRLAGLPWLLPLTALLLRARTVRPASGFALRELLRVHAIRVYRLAGSGLKVTIRHRTADPVTLGEVFHERDYVPLPELATRLAAPARIVDLGANIGLFGVFAADRWPGARIEAYEPDPANVAVHRHTIEVNRLADRWTLIEAAAGAREGTLRFLAGQASLSRAVDDSHPSAIDVPVRDVMERLAGADLVKIDIEGGEWEILADPRFAGAPPRAVVLEYHPHLCPGADARRTATELLGAAGLTVAELKRLPGGHGMLWGWRT
jgi:FkbM family methyltransferase